MIAFLLLLLPLLRLGDAFLVATRPSSPPSLCRRRPSDFPPAILTTAPCRPSRPNARQSFARQQPGTIYRSATTSGTTTTSSSSSSSDQSSLMGGTAAFESWFRSKAVGGKIADGIRHATFKDGSLRGLEFVDGRDNTRGVIELPEKIVLRTDYSRNKEGREEEDWDAKLAVMLVRECLKGADSDLSGYCSLLTCGVPFAAVPVPPPTAPDALRHWTSSQKARLKKSPSGERILKAAKNQARRWSDKYASLPAEDRAIMTEAQFLWGMEAVHSRAFRGNFGGGLLNQLQRLTIPFVAAAFGLIVLLANDSETADLIAQVCGLLVLGPALLSMVEEGGGGMGSGRADAVLLPFIDSANHVESAESNIEYDPVNGMFVLDLGKNCVPKEDDGRTQLYVSYGMRGDKELLLNYGFLPGVDGGGSGSVGGETDEETARDRLRARIAEKFLLRNP